MTRARVRAALPLLAGAVVSTGTLAPDAFAQTAFFNGGFELPPVLLFDPVPPAGWHFPGTDPELHWRTNGDGLNGYTAHSGQHFIQLDTRGDGFYRGVTTDIRNFVHDPATGLPCVPDPSDPNQVAGLCPGPWGFYDAPFNWDGGDVSLSAWINIPESFYEPTNPIGEWVELKVDIKGAGNGNENNATFCAQIFSTVTHSTNGQWVQLNLVVPIGLIHDTVNGIAAPSCNATAASFPTGPRPDRAKVTVGRWSRDVGPTRGIVLVDDVTYSQAPGGPAACSIADVCGIGGPPSTSDGLITGDDFNAFISAFAAGDLLADICGIGGPPSTPDGLITGDDFNAFIAAFAAGCP